MDYKATILDAAVDVLYEKGFGRATTDEIAAAADVSKRTLYRHLKSKENLLFELHERFLDRRLIASAEGLEGDPENQFRGLVRNCVLNVSEHHQEIRIFFEGQKHLSPANQRRITERRDEFEGIFRNILRAGMADGTFREMDVTIVSEGVLGCLTNLYQWYRPDGEIVPEELATLISDMVLFGLRPTPGGGRPRSLPDRSPITLTGSDESETHAATRETILAAARDLFSEVGYNGARTRALSERAGISIGLLYYYIDSKEELLYQINRDITQHGNEDLRKILSADNPADVILRQSVVNQCERIDRNLEAVRVFATELRFMDTEHYKEIAQLRREYLLLFTAAIDALRPAGGNVKVKAMIIIGMINSMHFWYRRGGPKSASEVGNIFADLLLHGLLTRR